MMNRKSLCRSLLVLGFGLLVGACADETLVSGGDPVVSFSADIQPLLMDHCGGCHLKPVDGSGALSFGANAELAYAALMDQPTANINCANLKRVDSSSSDPMRSSLYVKIVGTTCGKQMPAGKMPFRLTEAEMNMFRLWILQGAQNN